MADISFQTKLMGFDEVKAALKELPLNIQATALKSGMNEASKVIALAATANAPRKTGRLARAIKAVATWKVRKGLWGGVFITHGSFKEGSKMAKKFAGGYAFSVVNDAYYWQKVERGTRHSHAIPFLRNALMQTRDRAKEVIRDHILNYTKKWKVKQAKKAKAA